MGGFPLGLPSSFGTSRQRRLHPFPFGHAGATRDLANASQYRARCVCPQCEGVHASIAVDAYTLDPRPLRAGP